MKCLDKKRIKLKQGETLALNERIMLSMVSITLKMFIYNNITRNFNLKVGAGLKATRKYNSMVELFTSTGRGIESAISTCELNRRRIL